MIRNHLHHKKNFFGPSLISCSYCEKLFCEYHCVYTKFAHFKCIKCEGFKSVCENCACESTLIKKICFDCEYINSISYPIIVDHLTNTQDILDKNDQDIYKKETKNNENDELWQEILKDLNLSDEQLPFSNQGESFVEIKV